MCVTYVNITLYVDSSVHKFYHPSVSWSQSSMNIKDWQYWKIKEPCLENIPKLKPNRNLAQVVVGNLFL